MKASNIYGLIAGFSLLLFSITLAIAQNFFSSPPDKNTSSSPTQNSKALSPDEFKNRVNTLTQQNQPLSQKNVPLPPPPPPLAEKPLLNQPTEGAAVQSITSPPPATNLPMEKTTPQVAPPTSPTPTPPIPPSSPSTNGGSSVIAAPPSPSGFPPPSSPNNQAGPKDQSGSGSWNIKY